MVPKGVKVSKTYPMEDFDLYTCSQRGVTILNFYVGNSPSFPGANNSTAGITETTVNGMQTKDLRRSGDNTNSRETLIKLSAETWPQYVHFWYSELSQIKSETADSIIISTLRRSQ
jgi:hypothetical protein